MNRFLVFVAFSFLPLSSIDAQTFCDCEHTSQPDPAATATRKFTIWMGPGSMKDYSQTQQTSAFKTSLKDYQDVCNIAFTIRDRSAGSQIRMEWKRQDEIFSGALGAYYGGGKIWLNSTRDVGLARNPNSRIPMTLITHEIGHHFGLQHSANRLCIMDSNGTSLWFCPNEVLALQKKYGKPSKKFYPLIQRRLGAIVRGHSQDHIDLIAERDALILQRTWWINNKTWDRMLETQAEIIDNVDEIRVNIKEIKTSADKWKAEKARWQNVPMAG